MQNIAGTFADGVTDRAGKDDYTVLAEIGISFLGYGATEDASLEKTLETDEVALNEALLNNPSEVMELFLFRGTADNSDISMTGFSNNTGAATYDLNIDAAAGAINSVTYDVTINGVTTAGLTATVTGSSIVTEDGLRLFYGGDKNAADTATVTTTNGIGSQLYFELDAMLDDEDGTLTQAIADLETQNTSYEDKVGRIDESLARQREILMDKFISMEAALSRMKNIQSSLDELMAAGKESS